jgi:hypothetical protein
VGEDERPCSVEERGGGMSERSTTNTPRSVEERGGRVG